MPESGRYLLDTNIVIALFDGDNTVAANLAKGRDIFIPSIVIGELFFGALKSARPSENIAKVEGFTEGRVIVPCDLGVAREYGRLRLHLRKKGRPLPENDVWIAAMAKYHEMTLATRDGHFHDVDDLLLASW